MKRGRRMLIVGAAAVGSFVAVAVLARASSRSEGPLATILQYFGTTIGSAEHSIWRRVTGAGRASELRWFAPYRDSVARLRHPDRILLGIYDGTGDQLLSGVATVEERIGVTLPIVQFYSAWGDKPDQAFPLRVVTAIRDYGSAPLITWEPWLTDFQSARHPGLLLPNARTAHGLAAVARGDYDFYVNEWASAAAKFGKPILLRFAHEMNDPYRYPWGPQNNTKEEYIAAWRHVVERFRARGAKNVLWVWSPHVAYEYWDLYYPGDDVVDWVATGALNFGPIAKWSQWWSFHQIFGTKYARLASFGKPVMVAEFGSLAVGGDRAAWYRDALTNMPAQYPALRALVFFNTSDDQTVTYQRVDWTITADSVTADAVAGAAAPWAPGPVRPGSARGVSPQSPQTSHRDGR